MEEITVIYGEAAKRLPKNTFKREGYLFSGWNTLPEPSETESGTSYADMAPVSDLTEDLELYAQWVVRPPKSLSDPTISLILNPKTITYDGMEHEISYKVFDSETGEYLTEGVDFELDEENSVTRATEPDTYIVTVTADNKTGSAEGTKAVTGSTYYGTRSGAWQIIASGGNSAPALFRFPDEGLMLPNTGFPTSAPTELAPRPKGLAYNALGLSLLVPRFDIETDLTMIPLAENTWTAEWIGSNAGILEGSSLPGDGYSIIAAHNTLNNTEYGPFARLFELKENDMIFVRTAQNELLRFKVYDNKLIDPDDFEVLRTTSEKEPGSMILVTCENETPEGKYLNRRAVFAKPQN